MKACSFVWETDQIYVDVHLKSWICLRDVEMSNLWTKHLFESNIFKKTTDLFHKTPICYESICDSHWLSPNDSDSINCNCMERKDK